MSDKPVKRSKRTSQPTVPPVKTGWAIKLSRSGLIKNKQNRFFVLRQGLLSYYVNSIPEEPFGETLKGSISLGQATISKDKKSYSSTQIFLSPSSQNQENSLLMEFNTGEETEEWKEAIELHIQYLADLAEYEKKVAEGSVMRSIK